MDDLEGKPTIVELGSLRMQIIRRGANGHLGLRVRDTSARSGGIHRRARFRVDPTWRIVGRFEPAIEPRIIPVPDIIGDVIETPSPGDVILPAERRAADHALEEEDDAQWLIFGDATNGTETYAAGRFLVTDPSSPMDR